MYKMTPCALCGSREATEQCDDIEISGIGTVHSGYSACDECGAEVGSDNVDLFLVRLNSVA